MNCYVVWLLVAAMDGINGRFAIRQGSWKLELCPGSGGWGKPGDEDARKDGGPDVQNNVRK